MPSLIPFAHGYHARPLLDFTRAQIKDYSIREGLQWIEDTSNESLAFDRNYLRTQVIPITKSRWPALAATLSRSARLCAEAVHIIDDMARIDMSALACVRQDALNLEPWRKLSAERQRNVLRYWLQTQGLPVPNYAVTQELVAQVLTAAGDSLPLVAWQGAEVRRYGARLYAMAPMTAHNTQQRLCWDLRMPLDIPGVVSIQAVKTLARGLSVERLAGRQVQIRFRQGGETCRLAGRQQTFTLKNLLQQWRVLPWMRKRIPLVYVGEELAAVGDFAYCWEFAAAADEMGWTLHCEYSQPPTE